MAKVLFRSRLDRPTGFYFPLLELADDMARADGHDIPLAHATSPERDLKRSDLHPDRHWFDKRTNYVQPPKKPTVTPAPSAKGKAAVPSAKSGGGGSSDLSSFSYMYSRRMRLRTVPLRHLNQPMLFACRRREEYELY